MSTARNRAFAAYPDTCDACGHDGSDDNRLEVHHRDRDHSNNDPDNLRILCHDCHFELHARERITVADTIPTTRVQRNFSLDPEHVLWIEEQARQEGHGNASRILQRLIEMAALQRDGYRWRDKVQPERNGVAA